MFSAMKAYLWCNNVGFPQTCFHDKHLVNSPITPYTRVSQVKVVYMHVQEGPNT